MTPEDFTEGLDPDKPLTDGRAWGLISIPAGPSGIIILKSIPVNLSSPTATPSLVAARLGFPLQCYEHESTTPTSPHNFRTQALFFEANPDSPKFGNHLPKTWRGDVVFARIDGKKLHGVQLTSLGNFLDKQINPFMGAMWSAIHRGASQEDIARLKSVVVKRLTPEAFHAFYMEESRLLIKAGQGQAVKGVSSPVSVTVGEEASIAPACGACYGLRGNDGKSLVKCSGCGVRWYCNKHCQKHDWNSHKTVCSKST